MSELAITTKRNIKEWVTYPRPEHSNLPVDAESLDLAGAPMRHSPLVVEAKQIGGRSVLIAYAGPHPTAIHSPIAFGYQLVLATGESIGSYSSVIHIHQSDALEKHAWDRMIRIIGSAQDVPPSGDQGSFKDLKRRFREYADKWKEETWMLSSITDKIQDPAYVRIIALGPKAIPLILAELEREPDYWFWALRMLTDEDPVPADADFDVAVKAWLDWGRARGHLATAQFGALHV